MYHVKMTANIYNIWPLAYRTTSLVFERHRYDVLCVYLVTTSLFYVFPIIV